jgi:hypothetical protein
VNPLFKLALPSDFRPDQRSGAFVAVGPSDRQIQAGSIPWRGHLAVSVPIVELLIRLMGPQPFLGGLASPSLRILEQNAEPGSVQITAEERSRLGGRPALLLKARYAKGGQPLQVHGYFSFSYGKPVYLFLIARQNDAMDWAAPVAEQMQLFN